MFLNNIPSIQQMPKPKKNFPFPDKEPPRKVIIGRSSANNGVASSIAGDLNKQSTGLEKKSIYSRLGGKTSDGLDIKREKVSIKFLFYSKQIFFQNFSQLFVVFIFSKTKFYFNNFLILAFLFIK